MAMENTTVDPKNKNTAAIGCSVITTDRDKNKGLDTEANGPKFSVEQGEEALGIAFGIGKCEINDLGEMIVDGVKSNAKMSEAQQNRYAAYRKHIEGIKKQRREKDGFTH